MSKIKIIFDEYNIYELVSSLSCNYTKIIHRDELKDYKDLDWGNNGVGDRWAKKKFNYTVIYKNKTKTYSENLEDKVDDNLVESFQLINNKTNMTGIIGIFVHSIKNKNNSKRLINKDISRCIKSNPCVSCGSTNDIVCDHKNDLYNDERVLDIYSQSIDDFQPLCNHCNLQKRQICKEEKENKKLYSAKRFRKYSIFPFEFPWEKKNFDLSDIDTKKDSYWYDPVEFNNKIYKYMKFVLPIIEEIKRKDDIIVQLKKLNIN